MSKISYEQINSLLWHASDLCRGLLDVSQSIYYVTELLYLKRLSDMADEGKLSNSVRVIVPEEAKWTNFLNATHSYGDLINRALHSIESSNPEIWNGELTLIDFNDRRLGDSRERDQLLSNLIRTFSAVSLKDEDLGDPVILGQAFQEYVEQTMIKSGLKGGEYLTPTILSELVVALVQPQNGMSVSDPVLGTGGFLVESARYVKAHGGEPSTLSFSGQEINMSVALLAKLNMFFNNIYTAQIKTGDSINSPQLLKEGKLAQFDRVIAEIPFGVKDLPETNVERDPYNRFSFGIPPKSKGEFKFIQHAIAMMKPNGMAGIITAPGLLFRGGVEADIRRGMIEADIIDTIIALPAGIFYSSAIPASIIIFKKQKESERKKKILFIDISKKETDKKKGLSKEDVKTIVETFNNFRAVPGFSHVISFDEIAEKEFNLNVSRYSEESVQAEKIDIHQAIKELETLEQRRESVVSSLFAHYRKLGYTNTDDGERNS